MPTVAAQLRLAIAAALLAGAAGACQGPDPYYRHLGPGDAGAGYGGGAGFAPGTGGVAASTGVAGSTGAAGTIGAAGATGSGAAGTMGAAGSSSAGAAGTTGAGGASGTGTAGAGAAGIGAPCTTCMVKVEYTCRAMDACGDAGVDDGGGSSSGQASFVLDVTNEGSASFPLSTLTLRYWYTVDASKPQELDCDFAKLGCTNIVTSMSTAQPKFVQVMPPRAEASEYVEIAFTAGALALDPFLDTGEIQLRLHNKDFSPIVQCDDYSYDCPMTGSTIDAKKITAYLGGVLVWGTEPQ